MSNMTYVQFENTYRDLQQCYSYMWNDDELSESEKKYREWLIELCQRIANEYGEENDD